MQNNFCFILCSQGPLQLLASISPPIDVTFDSPSFLQVVALFVAFFFLCSDY